MNKTAQEEDQFLKVLLPLGIFLSVILGFYLNLRQPLRIDELAGLNLILTTNLSEALTWLKANDTQQPLFYVVLKGLTKLSIDIVFFKVVLYLFALASLIFHFKISRHFLSKQYSLYTTLLLSLSFPFILHSAEIRPYGLYLFLALGGIHFVLKFLRKSNPIDLGISGIFFILAFLNHYVALSLGISSLAFLFLIKRIEPKIEFIGFIIGVFLIALTPFKHKILWMFNHEHPFREPLSLKLIGSYSFYLGNGLIFFLLVVGMFTFNLYKKRKLDNLTSFFIAFGIIPFSLLIIRSIFTSPALEPRYVLFSLSPIVLFPTFFISELKKKTFKGLLGALLVLALFYNIFGHEKYHRTPYRIDTKKAAGLLREKYNSPDNQYLYCGICLYPYLIGEGNKFQCKTQAVDLDQAIIVVNIPKSNCPDITEKLENYKVIEQDKLKGITVTKYY
ncbi:MAG: glycosyltransferase family 39 protein [Halobacteriovoraceae bacterium]|nr:glycosyltransferase family 39 protein [Halobacteriovoraceae bacterium]